ncbi:esterase family protein [Sphingobacterium sp. SRCM116780]|uniref:alpha/beta hydrolase n=1 Tax=Sphingobacterium sp. SRCM116780 TaxID=2907623 RepID=UPI001F2F364F|nr:alpha/beta hydrolase family protein [Sphingobacterium sp. SRCM116780]UIR57141.1 esterase family protein [Sphingobacterium sp. SRCM116780]
MKSNFKYWLMSFAYIFLLTSSYAATVDTLTINSKTMNKGIKNVIILPEKYDKEQQYPVLYLLHGYSGRYDNWVNNVDEIKKLVDFYHYIVVCPDGGFDSWYWDVKGDQNYQYETFVSEELPTYIDAHYATKNDRSARAISGLSMGGHGALSLAFKHQDVYGAAGSTSGGLDIRPFPMNWNIKNRIGSYAAHPQEWESKSVINMINLLEPNKLALIIDCGREDFFYKVNMAFHDKLDYANIPHTFITRAGAHNWEYWSKSIVYQMAFFHDFFNKKQ